MKHLTSFLLLGKRKLVVYVTASDYDQNEGTG